MPVNKSEFHCSLYRLIISTNEISLPTNKQMTEPLILTMKLQIHEILGGHTQFYHFPLLFITRMPVLQTTVTWNISFYNPTLSPLGTHAQKFFDVSRYSMRESFILLRVTLAVTKRHFRVCHTRQMFTVLVSTKFAAIYWNNLPV